MIYEWRIYEIVPGKRRPLNERFANHTLALFKNHGIKVVGFWEVSVGATSNMLYYMLAFDDVTQRERAWQGFRDDPEWQKVQRESEKDGPLVAKITNMILTPTDYSPMK